MRDPRLYAIQSALYFNVDNRRALHVRKVLVVNNAIGVSLRMYNAGRKVGSCAVAHEQRRCAASLVQHVD